MNDSRRPVKSPAFSRTRDLTAARRLQQFSSSNPNRLSARKQSRPYRPNAHVASLIAAFLVLCTVFIMVRAAAIAPAIPHQQSPGTSSASFRNAPPVASRPLSSQPSSSHAHSPAAARSSGMSAPSAHGSQTVAKVVAADGTRFIVDLGGDYANLCFKEDGHVPLQIDPLNMKVSSSPLSIAFFVQVSAASLDLLPRLLLVMWHPRNVYVIHFDAKIDQNHTQSFRQAVSAVPRFNNVYFLPAEPITYKGVSMLLNTLAAIEFLLDVSHHWDYFINLSGSDYPLVNTGTIGHLLAQPHISGTNMSFIQVSTESKFWKSMKQSRFNYIYYDTALGLRHVPTTQLLHTWQHHPLENSVGVQFVHSEAWIIAHRSLAHYAARSSNARKLLLLLSMMQDPEEHFFAMLAWNNERFNTSLAHHAFRAVFWELNGTMSGQHPYYVDEPDEKGKFAFWDYYVSTSRCFFLRKVRNPRSAILDRIDRMMSGTHESADMTSVSPTHFGVSRFVKCISDVKNRPEHQIRSYNVCRYALTRSR